MAEGPYSTLHDPAMPPAPDDRMASVAAPRSLAEAIGAYLAARAAYDATEEVSGDAACDAPEWNGYLDAERALISHRCADEAERRAKVAFALTDRRFLDTIENDSLDGVSAARRFLSSLV